MKKIISPVIQLGIRSELPFHLQNKIRIYNTASLFILSIAFVYSFIAGVLHYYAAMACTGYELTSLLVGLFLIYKKRYSFAFHFAMVSNLFFVIVSSFLVGEKGQIHIYLLCVPPIGAIFFDCKKTISTYLIISLISMVGIMLLFPYIPPVYELSTFVKVLGLLSLIFSGILIFLSTNLFKTENLLFNDEINRQRIEVQEKNKDITDSIHYAKRIQKALMASDMLLQKHLKDYFIFYKPKDIVSGDFYWAESIGGKFLVAVCDCTGHGVPGAFMSLLNIAKLNSAVSEKRISQPDLIFNQVREDIIKALNPEGALEEQKDGMDAVLCSFDFENLKLDFTCANNPIWIIRKDENSQVLVHEFKTNKMPVGIHFGKQTDFLLQKFDLKVGDMVYMFTDGYPDQFGGKEEKKFKYSQLKELLVEVFQLPIEQQQLKVKQRMESWQGNLEQVDDVLILGIRV